MLTIQRLYIKEFLKVLIILGLGMSAVFSIINLIDKIDEFMPHKPPLVLLFYYAVLSIPGYAHYLLPMAILLSSLFVFSQAIKRREIIAIKTSGGKMRSILLPFVAGGIILTFSGLILGEVIIPATSKKIHDITDRIKKKKKEFTFKEGTMYMRGRDGSVISIALYMPEKNISTGISIYKFNAEGLKERIDAEVAEWEGKIWKLKKVSVHDIASGEIKTLKETTYHDMESPKIFQENIWKEEMSLPEMIRYQKRLNEAGSKNSKMTVDISSRLSYPLINLFMLLLGISLSMGDFIEQHLLKIIALHNTKERTGNSIISAGLGLFISAVYWLGYSFFLSLGYTGAIPPLVAPWLVPLVFAVFSVYLYRQIPE
ncbi:MAG: LptF/LptG family permease [Thermodesulfovibrionales bacterium]|nr:LptF/LptG family permease [Thermodesulfovibrionales bacterium]